MGGKRDGAADLYVDLGTANTLVSGRGKGLLLNEPSIVAYSEPRPGRKKVVAVGTPAIEVLKKNPGNVHFTKPIRDGVIADFELSQVMLKTFLQSPAVKKAFSRPRVVVSLPYGVTEVEKRAVVEACKSAGAREVFLIDEPMAAALGSGLPVKSPEGHMIIDIGGGTTEVAVIALSDIVYCEALRVGGHKIDQDIIDYFKHVKKIILTEALAETLKKDLGTALPKKDIRTLQIQARDASTGLHRNYDITSEDVGLAMNDALQQIVNAVHKAIEKTPPELVSDLIGNGVILAGGGALIKDLDLRLENEIRLQVRVAADPLTAIARGGERVLEDESLLEKIQLEF
ncbi:MAG: rod shape-determining protein [Bdellovibrionota bacterium]